MEFAVNKLSSLSARDFKLEDQLMLTGVFHIIA